ncbi:hypothetical protein LUZ63_013341 [Rhynchospora breviuscula]|uniref:Uncharacterized protein n=1 Tax=Rhynchospora breviuscula TaxID=2022672 RepID=A0A9Q0HK47_9POAL|nr:hypothetical protein LUZ63_013341 [Rhynchospora breviuscula]
MVGKGNFHPFKDAAGSSRPSKSRGWTPCFPENTTAPSIQQVLEHLIREVNCKIEELQAKMHGMDSKIDELVRKLYILRNPIILENPTDEILTTREPVSHGRYDVRIIGNMKKRVYTCCKVKGQDGKLLVAAIYYNGEKILSGPLAFARFEVLVLEGNFNTNDQESWTIDEFQGSLVKARKEVGSILVHDYRSQFSNGEAVLDGLNFKDNSSWAAEKKWRLGIRVLGSFNVRVQEAISSPFRVLDRHGKASEKPNTPSLEDRVECLQKVGIKRSLTLKKNKIYTVKDFLQLYHMNQTWLRKILGIKSEDESWKTMIRHAKKSDAGSNLYSYQKKNGVLFFNCVYEVVGAEFQNRYIPFDKLRDSKKVLVNKWRKTFYKNIKTQYLEPDFKILNEQPVPIECNFTGNSTDDIAAQCDQTAGLQNTQSANIILAFSDVSMPNNGRDADKNMASDHNTTQYCNAIPDETESHVQEQEGSFVGLNLNLELYSTSQKEYLVDSVEESCHVMIYNNNNNNN